MNPDQDQITDLIKQRFAKLPPVVQQAITSADVQQKLRALADRHKLHVDQWENLENQVLLTLLGINRSEDLEAKIRSEVGVSPEEAASLGSDIAEIVFEPIRQELERQLSHPDAVAKVESGVEQMRDSILAENTQPKGTPIVDTSSAQPIAPATARPTSASTQTSPEPQPQVVREAISESYKPGVPSTERKAVHDDPYRESPV